MGNKQSNQDGDGSTAVTSVDHEPVGTPEDFQYSKGVCALSYWEPIRLLGEGSISDIHLVVRRDAPIQVKYKEKRDVMALAKKNKKARGGVSENVGDAKLAEKKDVYVLKSIMKDHVGNERVLEEMRREIYTMSHLRHPHIVNVIEAYERRRHIYLVMEYCSGGDLTDRTFKEPTCAAIVANILSALAYMHSCGVVHRDIKLENIVFASSGEPKIIDYGLATKYLSEEFKTMTDKVGTLYSMAPQVLQGVYDAKCDMWSMGVVTYNLLSGYKPFWGPPRAMPWPERRKIMIDRIMRCQYMKMQGPSWSKISQEAKDFCASLLKLDLADRPSAQKALDESPWLQKYANSINQKVGEGTTKQDDVSPELLSLSMIKKESELHDRRIVVRDKMKDVIVTGLTDREISSLRTEVETRDTEGTGRVSIDDLRSSIQRLGSEVSVHPLPSSTVATIVDRINDICREFEPSILEVLTIEYHDFFARAFEEQGRIATEAIAKACDDLDVEGKRMIPLKKLLPSLDESFSNYSEKLAEQLTMDELGMVSTIQVLELAGIHVAQRTRNSIRSGQELGDSDEHDNDKKGQTTGVMDTDLMDETNTAIPGGIPFDSDNKDVKFVYDAIQKSFRKNS